MILPVTPSIPRNVTVSLKIIYNLLSSEGLDNRWEISNPKLILVIEEFVGMIFDIIEPSYKLSKVVYW